MQCVPRNVWIWKAKSSAVQPAGIVIMSPFGEKTNISDANRFSFMASRKSIASGCGSSRISLIVCNHPFSSSSATFSVSVPVLYFQWAAKPCSAISSIFCERICTSIHCPMLLIRVTCSAWYPLAFGCDSQSRNLSGCDLYSLQSATYMLKHSLTSSSGIFGVKMILTASMS